MDEAESITCSAPKQAATSQPGARSAGPCYFVGYRPPTDSELAVLGANLEAALQQQALIEAGAASALWELAELEAGAPRRRRAPRPVTEPAPGARLSSQHAAGRLGISVRKVQQMALAGQIPGAAQIGGRWTFDPDSLDRYIRQREAAAWPSPAISIVAKAPGTGASRAPAGSIAAVYRRAIGLKPSGG